MGQKVNPVGFRTGIMIGWKSRWYASKREFGELLVEDHKIRKFVKDKYRYAGLPKIEIERIEIHRRPEQERRELAYQARRGKQAHPFL